MASGTHIIQPMIVVRADGSTVTTCCGPAALKVMGDERRAGRRARGYQPVGEGREGICCHTCTCDFHTEES